ncbi:peptide-methionine (S)-S-oxide reductase [Christiangramia sp. SM2212]|uniref:peptide-methionine (S)-S-oxide reductase n=1 Tax=Christiangramia sediminicola TaxID=3073267 RepID=UPI0038D0A6B2
MKGVEEVRQGYISTSSDPDRFYEGVLINYDPDQVELHKLIEIHLKTHKSTSNHSMRDKYLSAVYTFHKNQEKTVNNILNDIRNLFPECIITRAYNFGKFIASRKQIQNYYLKDPERPFCKRYIEPKLEMLKLNETINTK